MGIRKGLYGEGAYDACVGMDLGIESGLQGIESGLSELADAISGISDIATAIREIKNTKP